MKTQARVRRMSAERPNISALTVMRRGYDRERQPGNFLLRSSKNLRGTAGTQLMDPKCVTTLIILDIGQPFAVARYRG